MLQEPPNQKSVEWSRMHAIDTSVDSQMSNFVSILQIKAVVNVRKRIAQPSFPFNDKRDWGRVVGLTKKLFNVRFWSVFATKLCLMSLRCVFVSANEFVQRSEMDYCKHTRKVKNHGVEGRSGWEDALNSSKCHLLGSSCCTTIRITEWIQYCWISLGLENITRKVRGKRETDCKECLYFCS